MEKKDNDDGAAGSTPPHNGGKLPPIKIKITKKAAEEASASAEDQVKSHYCKECNKSFSSGKALGGHMSSAHVQANKDYSGKKLSSGKRKLPAASNSGSPEINCGLCGRVFQSHKSLFGHMRCHPERDWRGMDPPESKIIGSSSSSGDEDDVIGDQIDPGRQELGFSINGWPTSKRGRGAVSDPTNRGGPDSFSPRSEKGPIVAGQKLLKKLSDESRKEKLGGTATDGGGKGKEKVDSCTDQEPDGIDPNDELLIAAIEVLANGKRAMEAGTASSSQFRCTFCDKVFSKHQALGGHCASHLKFKVTVVNTNSRPAKLETPPKKRKATPKKEKPVVKSNAEAPASTSASFAFDLNMAPAEAEEEEMDMEGLSNNTSPDYS